MFNRGTKNGESEARRRLDRVTRLTSEQSRPQAAPATPDATEYPDNLISFAAAKRAQNSAPLSRKTGEKGGRVTATIRVADHSRIHPIKNRLLPLLHEQIDAQQVINYGRAQLRERIRPLALEGLETIGTVLNSTELNRLLDALVDEMLGLGPIEPLLADPSINDIMINGPKRVYVERKGKLELTDVTLRDDAHVMHIATRIATSVGRRIDITQPMVDARLKDGSRVNIIVPPLAIDGPTISIRKFMRDNITLDRMAANGNMSAGMASFLKVVTRCRMNTLISGGTGSGKTTLLNAMSQLIDPAERIVTIEDAAELQLQQEHTVRLETRPANMEGDGEITMRRLVINALRMRPDRIILGEVRGSEAFDMLQAMNTGHEGSLGTIHANNPRESLTRLENMVGMAGTNMTANAIRHQVADAIDIIIHVERGRDGHRRVKQIVEVVGKENDTILTQELFRFVYQGEDKTGRIIGDFQYTGTRPEFMDKARYYGLEGMLQASLR